MASPLDIATTKRPYRGPVVRDVFVRIEAMVSPEPTSGCWLWTGTTDRAGYGQVRHKVDGKWRPAYVHRLMASRRRGRDLGPGECALHRCDNPGCVNPDHLFVGSKADNHADMLRKGRWRGPAQWTAAKRAAHERRYSHAV